MTHFLFGVNTAFVSHLILNVCYCHLKEKAVFLTMKENGSHPSEKGLPENWYTSAGRNDRKDLPKFATAEKVICPSPLWDQNLIF